MSENWAVIFDVDGTMVNNTAFHRQAWFDLCARYDIPLTHEAYHDKVHARSNDKIVPNLFGASVDMAFIRRIEIEKESLYRETFRPQMRNPRPDRPAGRTGHTRHSLCSRIKFSC